MGEVVVKAINNIYYVYGNLTDFTLFLKCLNEKLKVCSKLSKGQFSAFFSLNRNVSDEQLLAIFNVCLNNSSIILGFEKPIVNKTIKVIDSLYAGNDYYFDEDIIISSSIEADVYIKISGNLYVTGSVKGKIDLLNRNNSCVCAGANEAQIRICDSHFQNVTNLSTCKMYYNNRNVVIE
ncbi:MAG: hypothetical protein RSD85_03210 [Erysipelotrichaceae bacterium]